MFVISTITRCQSDARVSYCACVSEADKETAMPPLVCVRLTLREEGERERESFQNPGFDLYRHVPCSLVVVVDINPLSLVLCTWYWYW